MHPPEKNIVALSLAKQSKRSLEKGHEYDIIKRIFCQRRGCIGRCQVVLGKSTLKSLADVS